jgi:hypothetical protein
VNIAIGEVIGIWGIGWRVEYGGGGVLEPLAIMAPGMVGVSVHEKAVWRRSMLIS